MDFSFPFVSWAGQSTTQVGRAQHVPLDLQEGTCWCFPPVRKVNLRTLQLGGSAKPNTYSVQSVHTPERLKHEKPTKRSSNIATTRMRHGFSVQRGHVYVMVWLKSIVTRRDRWSKPETSNVEFLHHPRWCGPVFCRKSKTLFNEFPLPMKKCSLFGIVQHSCFTIFVFFKKKKTGEGKIGGL